MVNIKETRFKNLLTALYINRIAFNFVFMKKTTIWILGIVMGLSFLSLLYLQVSYIEEMVKMRKEQFEENVGRSLAQAVHNLELVETKKYLEQDVAATERAAQQMQGNNSDNNIGEFHRYTVTSSDGSTFSTFELKTTINRPSRVPKVMFSNGNNIQQTSRNLQEILKERYIYQRALLDEVVYSILYTPNDKPLKERVNFKQLDHFLKAELLNNGIDIPFHFTVTDRDGKKYTAARIMYTTTRRFTHAYCSKKTLPQKWDS